MLTSAIEYFGVLSKWVSKNISLSLMCWTAGIILQITGYLYILLQNNWLLNSLQLAWNFYVFSVSENESDENE